MSKRSIRRAALLVRVSTDQQKVHGGSLPDQERNLRQWCKENGYRVAEVYGHDDGSGGDLRKSPGFQKMKTDAESDLWDAVVVESVDRFRRDTLAALEARRILKD